MSTASKGQSLYYELLNILEHSNTLYTLWLTKITEILLPLRNIVFTVAGVMSRRFYAVHKQNVRERSLQPLMDIHYLWLTKHLLISLCARRDNICFSLSENTHRFVATIMLEGKHGFVCNDWRKHTYVCIYHIVATVRAYRLEKLDFMLKVFISVYFISSTW